MNIDLSECVPGSEGAQRRRERRFRAGEQSVRVVFERSEDGEAVEQEAQLLDFSTSGARLLVGSPARFQEAVSLRIENEEIGLRLSISANVCWISKHDEKEWRLGCQFEPALPQEALEELFVHRVLDRRNATRQPVQGTGRALWELSREPAPVEIVDLSEGGCCLRSPTAAAPNARLVLRLDRPDGAQFDVAARTQWQVQQDDGFLIGCQFVSNQGFDIVRSALELTVTTKPPVPRKRRGRKALTLLGIVAVVSWYCVFVLGR